MQIPDFCLYQLTEDNITYWSLMTPPPRPSQVSRSSFQKIRKKYQFWKKSAKNTGFEKILESDTASFSSTIQMQVALSIIIVS